MLLVSTLCLGATLSSLASASNSELKLDPRAEISSITPERDTQIALSSGRFANVPAPRGSRIAVSNGTVIQVKDRGDKIRITGKKQGSASVQIGSRVVHVHVLKESVRALHEKLDRVMAETRGLHLSVEDREIWVRGRLLRWDDWVSLASAAKGSQASYTFAAALEPSLMNKARPYFARLIREASLPEVPFELQPSAAVILPAEPADLKGRITQVLGDYGFRTEVLSSALSIEPLVRVRIIVAEIRKNMGRQLGIDWPPSTEAQLLPEGRWPADGQLGIGLKALETNGYGKILASPTLLCRSGKEAQFLAGGEFPIKIVNFKSQDVIWKRYGVLLKIQPRADFSGRMSIALQTEVSELDAANTVDGLPGLLTNRIESHFDLAKSRTIALSGLIKRKWGNSRSGIAGLSSLPILGSLFSSREFQEGQTELVVFVTPEIVKDDEDHP